MTDDETIEISISIPDKSPPRPPGMTLAEAAELDRRWRSYWSHPRRKPLNVAARKRLGVFPWELIKGRRVARKT